HYAGDLIDYLYPQPPFDHDAATRALTRTEICQPIMAALGLALADFLGTLGLRPDVVLGHSLGEIAAVGFSGLIGAEEALRLLAQRGRVLARLSLEDPGAVAASAAAPPAGQ